MDASASRRAGSRPGRAEAVPPDAARHADWDAGRRQEHRSAARSRPLPDRNYARSSPDGWDYGGAPGRGASGHGASGHGASGHGPSGRRPGDRPAQYRRARREPGLAGWQALVVLLVIAGIGGAVDVLSGNSVRGGFNIGLVVASIVAVVLVRRRHLLTIVVAPPLVYAAASVLILYVRSGGLSNRKMLLDAAVNWLVYGFPAMALATAAVLVIAGIRALRGRSARHDHTARPDSGVRPPYTGIDERGYGGAQPVYRRHPGQPIDPNL